MLVETAPLETGHGKGRLWLATRLACFELGEAYSTETRIEMKVQLPCGACLTIAQPGELFRVAEQKFDLEARFVIAIDRCSRQRDISAKQQRSPPCRPVAHYDQRHVALQLDMIDNLMVELDVTVVHWDLGKARQIIEADFTIIRFGPSWALTTWAAIEI